MSGKVSEYESSLSIIGLTKILTGNLFEKITWAIFVFTAMIIGVYLIRGYIYKYLEHDIYHDLSTVKRERAYFPSVTFCFSGPKYYSNVYYQPNCTTPKRKIKPDVIYAISNGLFTISYCTIGWTEVCVREKSAFSFDERMKNICFTWHPKKVYYQSFTGAVLSIVTDDTVRGHTQLSVTVHEQNIDPTFLMPQALISPGKVNLLKLKKFVTKRLPSPFPSKCSNKSRYHYFPGDYNRETCLSVNRHIEIFRKYGILNDISEKYVTDVFKNNRNLSKVKKGFVEEFPRRYKEVGFNNNLCPFACYETTYEVISSLMDDTNTKNPQLHMPQFHYDKSENQSNHCVFINRNPSRTFATYHVQIEFQDKDFYQLSVEKELYPWDKMLGEIGGILGLMVGASALSFLELLIYIILRFVNALIS